MKKTISAAAFALAAVASPTVLATAACNGSGASASVAAANPPVFVKRTFSTKCSANVLSEWAEANVSAGVVAGSTKGKSVFGGGTLGGGVKYITNCAASSGCASTDVTVERAQAARDSNS
ncbi:hypothetical protein [Accumulibacter sp.]|uniref:hypothetical protein n=1 Tax=Accumulibacter sp. TaxID=2053492 RepID=UPI00287B4F85|nr:hypothetical protein [Accumulibacter sp.]MDS4055162.1 hypothetical protein [Accumulibacter sp.]HMW57704.1 hypothetical protein [Accumulibacter sp.]